MLRGRGGKEIVRTHYHGHPQGGACHHPQPAEASAGQPRRREYLQPHSGPFENEISAKPDVKQYGDDVYEGRIDEVLLF